MEIKDLNIKLTKKEKIYNLSVIIAHFIPYFVTLIYCIIAFFPDGIIPGFIGGYVLACLAFSPFFCMYYGIISFVHTIVDEILDNSKSKTMCYTIIIISFILSSTLFASGIWAFIRYDDLYLTGLPLTLMIVSSILVCARFFVCGFIKTLAQG